MTEPKPKRIRPNLTFQEREAMFAEKQDFFLEGNEPKFDMGDYFILQQGLATKPFEVCSVWRRMPGDLEGKPEGDVIRKYYPRLARSPHVYAVYVQPALGMPPIPKYGRVKAWMGLTGPEMKLLDAAQRLNIGTKDTPPTYFYKSVSCNVKVKLTGYPRKVEIDQLYDEWLAVEVQGEYWHFPSEHKTRVTRMRKDEAKRENLLRDGFGYLVFWTKEIKKDADACAAKIQTRLAEGRPKNPVSQTTRESLPQA